MTTKPDVPTLQFTLRRRSYLVRLWALVKPYWFAEDRWAARGLLLLVVGLNIASVFVLVLVADWNRHFYDALQARDYPTFLRLIVRFAILAGIYIVSAVYTLYFNQMLQIRWRRWLTEVYYRDWLANRSYYVLQLEESEAENPEQRIQDDIGTTTTMTLTLGMGLLNAIMTLGSFLAMLWTLSGTLAFDVAGMRLSIPGYMLWVAVLYSAFGSTLTHVIGRALIGINFDLEKHNAEFRFRMIRIRENAESIAFYGGEKDEEQRLEGAFGGIWKAWWRMMNTQMRLTFFTAGYDQTAIIFPILVAAPRYFAGAIQLGGLTQTVFAFGRVQSSLSWLVSVYPDVAQWSASVNRLMGFGEALIAAKRLPAERAGIDVRPAAGADLGVEDMTLQLPDARVLLDDVSLGVRAGDRVVVSGPSGSGKSTLFRALSGIWPYGRGRVAIPEGKRVLFLPQKPYLPIATLREVLSYPDRPGGYGDAALRQALVDAQLPHLVDRLDEEANWSLGLSGGEQQRIGFARVFLYRPDWLFMDEATSALDEETEQALYALVRERLPDLTLVSVAHRAGVARFHNRRLTIRPATRSIEESLVSAGAV
jgi:putative ATP-binding cassette transporter